MTGRGRPSWWARKGRQFFAHVRARVEPSEHDALEGWLTPAQLELFDSMHVADRRHGLDVVRSLREAGVDEPDVLRAGLLHDAGKGSVGVGPRVVWSLGEAWGPWAWRLGSVLGMGPDLEQLRGHAHASAVLAASAGCSARTVGLIRHQDEPRDPDFGELLRLADEAN